MNTMPRQSIRTQAIGKSGSRSFQTKVPSGSLTARVYGYIRDGRFDIAKRTLSARLSGRSPSAGLYSLFAYCCYMNNGASEAAAAYAELGTPASTRQAYKALCAQSGLHSGVGHQSLPATKAFCPSKMKTSGKAAILGAFASGKGAATKGSRLQSNCLSSTAPEAAVDFAVLQWERKEYNLALEVFHLVHVHTGFRSDIAYNIGLCHFGLGEFDEAFSYVALIMLGVKHTCTEFNSTQDQIKDLRSAALKVRQSFPQTHTEATNLGAAMKFLQHDTEGARGILKRLPQHVFNGADPVSLHNAMVVNTEGSPSQGLEFTKSLLKVHTAVPEALANLTILYCKQGLHKRAADILARYQRWLTCYLDDADIAFVDALTLSHKSPDEVSIRLESCFVKQTERLTGYLQHEDEEARNRSKKSGLHAAIYRSLSALMAQAHILWRKRDFSGAERTHIISRLNAAHIFFMRGMYLKAIQYYEQHVTTQKRHPLQVKPVVFANLCTAYLLQNKNQEARNLLNTLHREQETQCTVKPALQQFSRNPFLHTSAVKLVVGTLYCMENTLDFGLHSLVEAVQPLDHRAFADAWYYVKRCILTLLSHLTRGSCFVQDDTIKLVLQFLRGARASSTPALQTPMEDVLLICGVRVKPPEDTFLRAALPNVNKTKGRITV